MAEDWKVYCMMFREREKTYVGCTNDVGRRFRQHNGLLAGGARYTTSAVARSRSPIRHTFWTPVFVVHGLPNRRAALQFEWALKHATLDCRTERDLVKRRYAALDRVLAMDRVTQRAEPLADWRVRVEKFQE